MSTPDEERQAALKMLRDVRAGFVAARESIVQLNAIAFGIMDIMVDKGLVTQDELDAAILKREQMLKDGTSAPKAQADEADS